jgi:hypothetical protein
MINTSLPHAIEAAGDGEAAADGDAPIPPKGDGEAADARVEAAPTDPAAVPPSVLHQTAATNAIASPTRTADRTNGTVRLIVRPV